MTIAVTEQRAGTAGYNSFEVRSLTPHLGAGSTGSTSRSRWTNNSAAICTTRSPTGVCSCSEISCVTNRHPPP